MSLVGLSGVLYPFSAFSSERMFEPKHGVSKVRMVALIWSESGSGLCGTVQVLLEISLVHMRSSGECFGGSSRTGRSLAFGVLQHIYPLEARRLPAAACT